jgi:hypothetical protein
MLRIPEKPDILEEWCEDVTDECMASSEERGQVYTRASQYYYTGTANANAAIYNKTKQFIDRLAGFLLQPTDVRFAIVYDSSEPEDVLQRGQAVGEKLTADYKSTDSDVTFSEANTWALINGCQLLKHMPHDDTFKIAPIHPQNFGVLSETTLDLDEQEAFVHVSYPTVSRLRAILEDIAHPKADEIIARIKEEPARRDQEPAPTYFHQMVVGGLQPLGEVGATPSAAGIVNVFPSPTPWRPNIQFLRTVKHCELWIKNRDNDYTTIQFVYPNIIIEGETTRRNLSKIPGHHPFVKLQAQTTPGYFWGRTLIADIQMLQDILSKRLRDLKLMWDRNVNAPQVLSGFTSVTTEEYFKIINEGGFINDPNPNAKANKLLEPPPENYLQELDFLFKLFDEAAGFSPIMGGQGEPGVRAGVHAQTLVRTSSPRLIEQAARLERQLAQSGYLCMRIMQAMDPSIYTTESGLSFTLGDMPFNFQVEVDSHSASPAFAEDNRQVAIALARAGAIDAEDLIHMLHPPGSQLLLARLKQRQKAQAEQAKEQKSEEMLRDVLRLPQAGHGMRRTGRK